MGAFRPYAGSTTADCTKEGGTDAAFSVSWPVAFELA
jgi:hypothetical protein